MKPALFVMLGYPGSGKTTFGRQLAEALDITRISSDDVRPYMYATTQAIRDTRHNPAVFGALDYIAEKLLAAGRSTIYDANFNRRKDRDRHYLAAEKVGAHAFVVWVRTPLAVARQREAERSSVDGNPTIPAERYTQLVDRLQEPTEGEKVISIDGLASFPEQLQAFKQQLAELQGEVYGNG